MISKTISGIALPGYRSAMIAAVGLLFVTATAEAQATKSTTNDSQRAVGNLPPRKLTQTQLTGGQVNTSPRIAKTRSARTAQNSAIVEALRSQKATAETERAGILSARMTAAVAQGKSAPLGPMGTLQTGAPPPCPPGKTSTAGQPCTPGPNSPSSPCPSGTVIDPLTGKCLPPCPPGTTSTATKPCIPAGQPPAPGGTIQVAPTGTAVTAAPKSLGSTMAPIPCAMRSTTIGTVNGQVKGTIFTPDPTYNLYTIKGCNFGDSQGQGHLNGPFAHGQVQLQIEFWTDTQIVAKVDPMISGEQDHDNVILVIAPSSGPQAQALGFKFYAAREEVELVQIPQSAITLATVSDNKWRDITPEYVTPSDRFPGASARVSRSDGDSSFGAGLDYYDFSGLAPGFTTSNMQLQYSVWTASSCYSGGTLYEDKNFNVAWDGDNIRLNFGYFHCHAPSVGLVGGEEIAFSQYGLSVWVIGPRGIDPWSK